MLLFDDEAEPVALELDELEATTAATAPLVDAPEEAAEETGALVDLESTSAAVLRRGEIAVEHHHEEGCLTSTAE